VLLKVKYSLDFCPAPLVNGLVGVADDEQVLVIIAENQRNRQFLEADVLKLVNHNVFEPLLPLFPLFCVVQKNPPLQVQQVLIIKPEHFALCVDVLVQHFLL
jgi:hypothetical protein